MSTVEVVMIRHAQSTWNAEGRFTGWADPPLTDLGRNEAEKAGQILKQHGYHFDRVFSSRLQRAKTTADIILGILNQSDLTIEPDWRLNERHYGALQGMSKQDLRDKAGDEQVHRWRRGYHDTAPALAEDDPRHPKFDPQYADLPREILPAVESLADTRTRAVEFWQEKVVPELAKGNKILLSAHGNTLRGLIMALAGMTEEEVEHFEIPTGTPIVYRFKQDGTPISWQYLE
ncbi:2,3-bisphosphoglycerate-dependent phosphoglycerate mutase [Saccharophagus sp. K07]|jgi:2,3-bisphosphoglycerate-dependent phosphoglycerate mutase|uniref:2,3-bisphosphoglycerate-dependent phosphoglycerate mutase n=1 Tax=Saccharophagus sp. K07 TaxID=2283636 RepID=UPI001652AF81|nr:2,3-bisphosphoglycerate-dependent phosphoglycerate mutase [Saccharophagus sp. K07]MBC6905197.1 2,3-bisphosphoglycerate-dependent phosphoglycerate mutase [Saccharophagus sp. K07]